MEVPKNIISLRKCHKNKFIWKNMIKSWYMCVRNWRVMGLGFKSLKSKLKPRWINILLCPLLLPVDGVRFMIPRRVCN